ncbi:DNA photolyase [Alphaproteobacteria bacterium GH1-50]|uniref:DNA photolyase n=1 Tax=Kangsaoukella pontilimi TaxID=2691042 RepID=A0A7C9MBX3_9RHOB|nr:FAD-binding domain-containing protein [Kangsaoukella pontilimi]MXQ06732.1 DNA photolyase [Kangsaoukella pontilimi]
MTQLDFPPTRTAALERLSRFLPHAGRDYAQLRNHDLPGNPHVSQLSPYLRHRVLTEEEVLASVLSRWSLSSAEKFVQEVVWRGYFKGWLERRPQVWEDYRRDVAGAWNRVQTEAGLRQSWEAACRGETGIDAFDHWAHELVETGYLHNHARMWFASIWCFTLELPWQLGADFFLRHLLDGDPASNTLSWRWVAGLHTRGKHYVARPANIAKYTDGRFRPEGLAPSPDPLRGPDHPPLQTLRETSPALPGRRTGLLLTEDELSPGWLLAGHDIAATLIVNGSAGRSPLQVSDGVREFTGALIEDSVTRYAEKLGPYEIVSDPGDVGVRLSDWAGRHGLEQVIIPHMPQGPARDLLVAPLERLGSSGVNIAEMRRPYDQAIWPHATAGFFKVKAKIPDVLDTLGLTRPKRGTAQD